MAKPKTRENRAMNAMRAYTSDPRWTTMRPDESDDLTDLLTDLMHLVGIDQVQWCFDRATRHYGVEKKTEEKA